MIIELSVSLWYQETAFIYVEFSDDMKGRMKWSETKEIRKIRMQRCAMHSVRNTTQREVDIPSYLSSQKVHEDCSGIPEVSCFSIVLTVSSENTGVFDKSAELPSFNSHCTAAMFETTIYVYIHLHRNVKNHVIGKQNDKNEMSLHKNFVMPQR